MSPLLAKTFMSDEAGKQGANIGDTDNSIEVDADKEVVEYTYRNGKHVAWDGCAPFIKVAIHYSPGADLTEVIKLENAELNGDASVYRSERWKTLTAANMLLELEVDRYLSICVRDKTPTVLACYKARQRSPTLMSSVRGIASPSDSNTVNISSKHVTLLNTLSEKGQYDLESTCIEVDGMSLLNLIYNFRNLIATQGQQSTIAPELVVKILETMIEDARRLLIRSPILTRVTKRTVIQSSRNTRYGIDTGKMFHTFTTSQGVAEMIQQGVGYYSCLSESKEETAKVKPRFLQMIVFLLSLLNDIDLKRLRPSLEMSYDLKADRQSIELTIFKVLTYKAVGPHAFLTGVISAVQMKRVEIMKTEDAMEKNWDSFLAFIGRSGWLLPGPARQVGRGIGSWKFEWNKSFVSSDIFDNLQYSGEKDTVNSIPPWKLDQEVHAELSNGEIYLLTRKDLDEIIATSKNRYKVTEPKTKKQSDLIVKEDVLFPELDLIWEDLENLCSTVNEYVDAHNTGGFQSVRRASLVQALIKRGKSIDPRKPGRPLDPSQYFRVQKPLGRRTKHTTVIMMDTASGERTIAVSWKLEGRWIGQKELFNGVGSDLAAFHNCFGQIRDFNERQDKAAIASGNTLMRYRMLYLNKELQKVERLLQNLENTRLGMQIALSQARTPEEPVTRVHFPVHFPGNLHWKQDSPFCRYAQNMENSTTHLYVKSELYVVAEQPVWKSQVATLRLADELSVVVTPMADVGGTGTLLKEDSSREVSKGETVLLLGSVLAVVKPQSGNYRVVNYLHLTSVDRGAAPRRRRRAPGAADAKLQDSVLV